jgi:hypothetical protein
VIAEDFKRALDALNNAKPVEMPDHAYFDLRMLKRLGYKGDAKPGDVIKFKGFSVHVLDHEIPT